MEHTTLLAIKDLSEKIGEASGGTRLFAQVVATLHHAVHGTSVEFVVTDIHDTDQGAKSGKVAVFTDRHVALATLNGAPVEGASHLDRTGSVKVQVVSRRALRSAVIATFQEPTSLQSGQRLDALDSGATIELFYAGLDAPIRLSGRQCRVDVGAVYQGLIADL